MLDRTKRVEEQSIPLPITQAALQLAQQFASQQPTQKKKEQVYLNTLAVCVVKDYMEIMDIPTDLTASDSWNPAMRFYADVADLKLTDLGTLECRPLEPGNFCYIPPEVPDDRIGVVVVKIDKKLQEATLLGFTKAVITGELSLDQLQSVDDLLEYLDCLTHHYSEVNLRQWLENIFETDWQPVEEILAPKVNNLVFRYKSRVIRGKLVDLGIHRSGESVVLIVSLTPKTTLEIQVMLQVYATGDRAYLPNDLSVKVLDEQEVTVMEAHARAANSFITLEFSAQLGERFSLKLELGAMSVSENFVV